MSDKGANHPLVFIEFFGPKKFNVFKAKIVVDTLLH